MKRLVLVLACAALFAPAALAALRPTTSRP